MDAATASVAKQKQPAIVNPVAAVPDAENPRTVTFIVRGGRKEDSLEKIRLLSRAFAVFFSLISVFVMATNKQGDCKGYDKYNEYRYCLAVAALAFFYSTGQVVLHVHRLSAGKDPISRANSAAIVNFAGDQIMAYMLISGISAAIPITTRIREGADNMFSDSSGAAISMAFFAFLALSLSSLVSGFKLANSTCK